MNVPQIPDTISLEYLHALLDKDLPDSEVIPEIDFGDLYGGLLDLQFVFYQLIRKSPSPGGTNAMQELTLALHLLERTRQRFLQGIEEAESKVGDFSDVDEKDLMLHIPNLKRYAQLVQRAVDAIQPLYTKLLMGTSEEIRRHLEDDLDRELAGDELAKYMLIGPHLHESLKIDRDSIDQFLNKQCDR